MTMRVLLREMPPMLRDLLAHAFTHEPGVELMSEPASRGPDPQASMAPDIVIVGKENKDDPADADGAPALLQQWPRSHVLLISTNGQHASMFELQPHRTALGEMSLDQLLQVVSEVARQRSSSPDVGFRTEAR